MTLHCMRLLMFAALDVHGGRKLEAFTLLPFGELGIEKECPL